MEILDTLKFVGLNEKEGSVYLALLELGTADVSEIAKKSGIKRPTCYLVLDDLRSKGLVSQVPAKINLFTAESPEKLSGELYKKQELLKRFLPNLQALHNAKKEKPQVQLFQGKEGVRLVYNKIFESDSVWFFGTIQEVLKIDPEAWEEFLKKAKERKFQIRDFLIRTPEDEAYAKRVKADQAYRDHYEIRFLPQNFRFANDNAIFGDNVVFFSFRPQIFAVMITSKEIAQSLKVLHELAWKNAELI
jgi:sugar-specific transcriptional regulator TrmB